MIELSGDSEYVVAALYFSSFLTAFSCLLYIRWRDLIPQQYHYLKKAVLVFTFLGLLFATLMPFGNPDNFVISRFTFDPLLGFRQMLNLSNNVNDTDHTNAWAFANLFLLWPMASTLTTFISRKKTLFLLFYVIVCLELIQGFVWQLGRSFEIADIVSNMLGAVALLMITRNWSHKK